MSDLIRREDAITAVAVAALDDRDELEALKALPSAESVSREDYEKIKNMVSTQFQTVLEDYLELEKRYVALLGKQSQKPSAEAEPTVIRSRTFMPTKDFKEWAKRIKEVNPNAVVIPCDAECASAEAVQGEWQDKEVFNETDDDHIVDEWQSARCSVCGKYHTTPFMYYFDNFNFCPNCGAKMHKGGEDNNA